MDQKTIQDAIDTVTRIGRVEHVTVQYCNLTNNPVPGTATVAAVPAPTASQYGWSPGS